jgi:hypothetical protein
MTGDGQSFREEICDVLKTRYKDDAELVLLHAIPQPMKSHIKRFGHLQIDAVIGEAYGNLVVAEDRCRRLGVSHILENLPLVGGDAGGSKGSGVLSLSNEGAYYGDTGAVGRDGVIQRGTVVSVAETVMASGDASGTGAREEGRVRE